MIEFHDRRVFTCRVRNKDKIAIREFHEFVNSHYVLVASELDLAGRTMVDCLAAKFGFVRNETLPATYTSLQFPKATLHISQSDLLHMEDLDQFFPRASAFIFLSKHKSDSKIPTLTCHCTGNFGSNPYGGNPRELGISSPSLQKTYLRELTAARNLAPEYEIVIEATHHGPTSLSKPVLFVELGSSESQWADSNAASLICKVVLEVIQRGPEKCKKVGIGLGGTHYPGKFNDLLLESEFGLAAVASKHSLDYVDEQMLDQMLLKSTEQVTTIIVDGKGLGSHKERILQMASKKDLELLNLK